MREGINFSRLHAMHPFKRSEGKGKLETFRTQKLLKYWYPVDSPKVVRLQNTVTTLSGYLLLVWHIWQPESTTIHHQYMVVDVAHAQTFDRCVGQMAQRKLRTIIRLFHLQRLERAKDEVNCPFQILFITELLSERLKSIHPHIRGQCEILLSENFLLTINMWWKEKQSAKNMGNCYYY